MRGEKRVDYPRILERADGAGRVDENTVCCNMPRRRREQLPLQCRQLLDVARGAAPSDLRMLAKRAESGARSVDQNRVGDPRWIEGCRCIGLQCDDMRSAHSCR